MDSQDNIRVHHFCSSSLIFSCQLKCLSVQRQRCFAGSFAQKKFSPMEDGYPAMMELADGTKVARGDKDWQYWKFAWRQGMSNKNR